MPFQLIDKDQGPLLLGTHDFMFLTEGTVISSATSPAIGAMSSTSSSIDMQIAGTVVSSGIGIDLDSSQTGDNSGQSGHDILVMESGSVTSHTNLAITMFGNGNTVTNFGLISNLSNFNFAIRNSGDFFLLRNSGTILGGRGISVEQNAAGTVANVVIENSGFIYGTSLAIISTASMTVTNSGEIKAQNVGGTGLAIYSSNMSDLNGTVIDNSGLISGQGVAIRFEGLDNVVKNSGEVVGDILFGTGDDIYRARGEGVVEGKVFGGEGEDILRGSEAEDNFNGDGDSDKLRGRGGDDTLRGGGAADSLWGGDGDDVLFGGAGKDRLVGGRGDDTLSGGAKADVFVMRRANGDDEIVDFEDGVDKIDLTSFGVANRAELISSGALQELSGGATLIDFALVGGSGSVLVEGMALADWNNGDFIF